MWNSPVGASGLVVLAVVTAFAMVRGDRWVRIGSAAYALTWLAVGIAQERHRLGGPQLGMLAADAAGAIALLWVALRARRPWAAAACAFQILGVANDVSFVVDLRILHAAEMTAAYIWGYAALAAIGIGAATSQRPLSGR